MKTINATKCQQESFALAELYKKVCDSNFADTLYKKWEKRVKRSFLSRNAIDKIKDVVTRTPDYRPIDTHQFDIDPSKAVWAPR